MTRKKAVLLILAAVLVLVITVVPLAATLTQSYPVRQASPESAFSLNVATPAGPGVIACDGCSGGGGGPG